ncbi:unnamed protein product [Polarella glacialis]|uniref:Uncharacterized protein n=1 Tax=Polarella glacialis TaxID=89957 RepID=A0A813GC53_POLGL|nr:unnamed protein product [Polarella glacialis]CAE8683538.1 unnamed protein product [Polarella glacialis]
MWASRVFVRDSFLAMFPERAAEMAEKVDPGEYGLESYWLRVVSCLLFMIGLWPDIAGSGNLFLLLWHIPTSSEPWMCTKAAGDDVDGKFPSLEPAGLGPSSSKSMAAPERQKGSKRKGSSKKEDISDSGVKFAVAGMPCHWKILNFMFVLLPKVYIWILTVDAGILFLMETAGIEDMVINAVALAFILELDEVIYEAMFSDAAKNIMDDLEGWHASQDVADDHDDNDSDMWFWTKHQANRSYTIFSPRLWGLIFPYRLVSMIGVLTFFQFKYYLEHCIHLPDGSWISDDLRVPVSYQMSIRSFLGGPIPKIFSIVTSPEVAWSMPTV